MTPINTVLFIRILVKLNSCHINGCFSLWRHFPRKYQYDCSYTCLLWSVTVRKQFSIYLVWILIQATTYINDTCIDNYGGGAAASSVATGVIALALQAK
jgi:hypothetical protein